MCFVLGVSEIQSVIELMFMNPPFHIGYCCIIF